MGMLSLYLPMFANKVLSDFRGARWKLFAETRNSIERRMHELVSTGASSCLSLCLRCKSVVLIVIVLRFTLAQRTTQFSDVLGSEGGNNFKN